MTPSIELLVHASGPSRGADDARYRREALEFLQFEVAERHTLVGFAPGAVKQTRSHIGTTSIEEDQSQRLRVALEAQTSSQAEKDDHESRIPDWPDQFPPLRTPNLSRVTASTLPWTTTKQTPHLLIEHTPALPRPQTAPTQSTPSQAPRLRRSQSDSWQTPPSVIPDSQPTPPSSGAPEISSSPCLKRPFASSSPSPTRHASPPPVKRSRLQIPSSPPSEGLPFEALPPVSAPSSPPPITKRPLLGLQSSSPPENHPAVEANPPAAAPSSLLPSADNRPASLEIHPPRPKTSNKAFKTHLTHSLTNIAIRLPLAQFFKPITTTRTLRTLERGHWLIPIASWDEELKQRFWDFLTEFVGQNGAGWGTWCVREFQEPIPNPDKESHKENQAPRQGEVVKIYCWGEVVGEIWLVLFIASGRKVKGIGAQWVDAGGVAVVVMG